MSKTLREKPLLVAFLTMFADLLGFGIIIPISAFYAESLGASPTQVTLLGASYSFMQFLFAPVWGRLSDRYGRRPIILISVFISVLGYIIFGTSNSLPILFFARMLAGFGAANIATVQAVVSDVTTAENRAKGMGIIGAAFGLGFIVGPAIGGLASQWGNHAPPLIAAAISAINFVFAFVFLKETLNAKSTSHQHMRRLSLSTLRHAYSQVNIGYLVTINLVFYTGFAMMEQVISLFIESVLKGQVDQIIAGTGASYSDAAKLTAYFLVSAGVVSTVIQGGLIGRLSKKYGERRLLLSGLMVASIGMIATPHLITTVSLGWILFGGGLIAVGSALYGPSVISLLTRSVQADEQGGTLGLLHSCAAMGRILGPASAGILFEINSSLPFIASGLLVALCIPAAIKLRQPEAKPA